jgi:hypothetical protein
MRALLAFFMLCYVCIADTNNLISPVDIPHYINSVDAINNYTETTYRLKTSNFIITGESIKDFTLNRVLTFTTFKISF